MSSTGIETQILHFGFLGLPGDGTFLLSACVLPQYSRFVSALSDVRTERILEMFRLGES